MIVRRSDVNRRQPTVIHSIRPYNIITVHFIPPPPYVFVVWLCAVGEGVSGGRRGEVCGFNGRIRHWCKREKKRRKGGKEKRESVVSFVSKIFFALKENAERRKRGVHGFVYILRKYIFSSTRAFVSTVQKYSKRKLLPLSSEKSLHSIKKSSWKTQLKNTTERGIIFLSLLSEKCS